MTTFKSLDLQEVAKALMLSQFHDKPIVNALLDSWTKPLQDFEDTIQYLLENGGVTNAKGYMLDVIGSWMGVKRESRQDPTYRNAILGRAITDQMDGTTERFLEGLRVLSNTNGVTFFEVYPATLYPILGEGWTYGIISEIQRIRQAGVETRVLLASGLKYQMMGEVGAVDNILHTQDEDTYQVVVDGVEYDLVTSVVQSAGVYGTTTTYAEAGIDIESSTPLADVVLSDADVVSGFLVDSEGNQIVDSLGNPIAVIEYAL